MKQRILLILMLCASLIYSKAKANETEPNDTKAQANTLALNGSNSGKINPAGEVDWWKVTTNGDGKLDITLTPLSGKYTYVFLYDNDGVTQLAGNYSNAAFTISADGLATGTYFLKVVCYYNTDTSSYLISNQLTKPAQANDAEPDSTKSLALTLPLNNSVTGHVGYFYNNHRDTTDWYKLTTNADGVIRLSLTPANGQYTFVTLYDHDGTTVLNSSYSNAAFSISTDGLAAGTYYARVYCYYTSGFAPYTLADSLFKPAQANDAEPDSTKALALTLPLNNSVKGHVGYYYNNHRDTTDWYKLTTNADGLIRLTLTPANGQYTYVTLYDHDGATVLNSGYSNTQAVISTDGLTAGTYYARVYCYYTSGFAPYTLADSLFTYTNANDVEPNNQPYLANTLPANTVTPGHVGFYYNNQRDTSDWWKINYTGTGSLSVSLDLEPTKLYGGLYTYLQIWKDTLVAPIFNNYTNTPNITANFTSLTQGYYYVRVIEYYNSQFESYTLTPTFTQVSVAKISIDSYDTVGNCADNTINYKLKKSSAPYTVKLYQNGSLYDTKISDDKSVQFKNLPNGSYYAKVYGDGATGSANSTSKTALIEPVVKKLTTTDIKTRKATLTWNSWGCADTYSVKYRVHGAASWTTKETDGNTYFLTISNLITGTTYEWKIAVIDSTNTGVYTGDYSDSVLFTTPTSFIAEGSNNQDNLSVNNQKGIVSVSAMPNPAVNYFRIQYNSSKQEKVNAVLFDANGKTVWASGLINASFLNGKYVSTNQFSKGVFYLKLISETGAVIGSTKIIIAN